MSNHLAFATLTYVLRRELEMVVSADVTGAHATIVRPDAASGLPAPGVNVFLLEAASTGEMGSFDLPTRDARGAVVNRPQGVYELTYLLTFHGDEANLEPQRVQASVLRRLHAQPVVTKAMIRDAVTGADAALGLTASNLADQISLVKLTPFRLSLDDLSKVWSVFFQTHYVLTSAFKATYVVLDAERAGQASLPVKSRGPFALPMDGPTILRLLPDRIASSATADVVLQGQGLIGEGFRYLVDDAEAALGPDATASAATIRIPATIKAGVKRVRVVAEGPIGTGHRGKESNVVPLLLLPSVTSATYQPMPKKDPTFTVVPAMTVGADQRVSLLLNRTDGALPPSYELVARPRAADADPLVFPALGVASGSYLYRLRVDGLDSALVVDEADPDPLKQPYVGPTVGVAVAP